MADEVIRWVLMSDRKKLARLPLRGWGIRHRLLIWGLSLFGIALTAVVVASYFYTLKQIEQDAAELQAEIASVTADRIHVFVRRKIERFSDMGAAVSLYEQGSKEQRLLLSLLVKKDSSFTDASIIDARGMEVLKVSDRRVYFPSDLSDQSKSAKFNEAIKGENYISQVYTSDKSQPYVTLAIPLWGTAQSIVGVVSAEADLSFLWEAIGEIRFGTGGYAYLVDQKGNLIAHKDPQLVLKKMNLRQADGVQKFLRNPTRSDPSPAHKGRGLMDRPVLSTYAPVPELGWAVILEEPLDAALANVEQLKRYALALLAVSLFVGAAVIAWVSDRITGPIRELHEGAKTIGSGNLDYRVNIGTGDEIEWLGEEFNKMAAELKVSYATLEQKVEQRTRALSALYDVTTTITQLLDLDAVLEEVIKKINTVFHFDATTVFLFNADGSELYVRAAFESEPGVPAYSSVFKRGQGLIGRVAETGEPIIFEDRRSDLRYHELSHGEASCRAGFNFLANLPIRTGERCIGVLACNGRERRRLSPEEIGLLTSMADHIGVAVERATLFANLKDKTGQLEKANLELEQANRDLLQANKAKDEFLSVMSHELRTPLNVVMGYTGMIKDRVLGEINPEQERALEKVITRSDDLLRMITEILAATSIEAQAVKVKTQEVSLGSFLDDLRSTYEIPLNKELALNWDFSPELPTMRTDSEKLKHILQNLINNAVKFTDRGNVTISARYNPKAKAVEFKVADTGIGIQRELLPWIFEMFRQGDSSETRSYGGVGIGLYIVKKFTDLLGGRIETQSKPGKGSIFTVTIPC